MFEGNEVKAYYQTLADDAKRKHAEENPGYHYTPRKASEKRRRISRQKRIDTSSSNTTSDSCNARTPPDLESVGVVNQHEEMGETDGLPLRYSDTGDMGFDLSSTSLIQLFESNENNAKAIYHVDIGDPRSAPDFLDFSAFITEGDD